MVRRVHYASQYPQTMARLQSSPAIARDRRLADNLCQRLRAPENDSGSTGSLPARESHEMLIRNATVFDGTWGRAGVAGRRGGRGGRIAALIFGLPTCRRRVPPKSSTPAGRWLIPGMLDIHTHFDLEVELEPGLPEAVRHGTTTAVVSNCSLGLAFGAQRKNGADPIVDCFARVENVPKHVLDSQGRRQRHDGGGLAGRLPRPLRAPSRSDRTSCRWRPTRCCASRRWAC